MLEIRALGLPNVHGQAAMDVANAILLKRIHLQHLLNPLLGIVNHGAPAIRNPGLRNVHGQCAMDVASARSKTHIIAYNIYRQINDFGNAFNSSTAVSDDICAPQ